MRDARVSRYPLNRRSTLILTDSVAGEEKIMIRNRVVHGLNGLRSTDLENGMNETDCGQRILRRD